MSTEQKIDAEQCDCGGSPHTTQCLYEHFLAYSGLPDSPMLRYGYFHGADAHCEQPVGAGWVVLPESEAFDQYVKMANEAFGRVVDHDLRGSPITDYDVLIRGAYGPAVRRLVALAAYNARLNPPGEWVAVSRKALADFIEYSVPGPYDCDAKWFADKQVLVATLLSQQDKEVES